MASFSNLKLGYLKICLANKNIFMFISKTKVYMFVLFFFRQIFEHHFYNVIRCVTQFIRFVRVP